MTAGTTGDLVRISWSQRDLMAPVLGVLIVGGVVLATLATFAVSLGDGGDVGSLVTMGAIAVACAFVVLRAVTRHAVGERWAMARRLRIVGMSGRRLRVFLLTETAAVAAAATALSVVLARYLAVPLLTPYLAGLGVVPAGTPATWRVGAVLATGAGTVLVALLGSFGATRALTRAEPAANTPPARASRSHRVMRLLALVAAAGVGLGILRAVAATDSDESAFLLGLMAAICLVIVLSAVWDPLVRGTWRIGRRLRRAPAAVPSLLSHRWRERQHQTTLVTATAIATVAVVYLGGYPAATDAIARDRLDTVLAGRTVAVSDRHQTRADTQALLANADGVVIADGQAVVQVAGATVDSYAPVWEQPITLLGGSDVERWLTSLGASDGGSPGVVLTRQEALRSGLGPGDALTLSALDGDLIAVSVVDVVAIPSTFGDYLVTDPAAADLVAGAPTLLLDSAHDAPRGWTEQPAHDWISSLPAGAAVSNSGGSGTLETPLLVGAPLALCLTLALAATVTTVTARRPDLRALMLLGITPRQRNAAVVRAVTADTLLAGVVAAALTLTLLTVVLRPYADATAISAVVPWSQLGLTVVPGAFWVGCAVAAVATATRTATTREA